MKLNVESINNSLVLQSITLQELAENLGVTKKEIINFMREKGFTYDADDGFFIKSEDLQQDLLKRVKELEKQQEVILELLSTTLKEEKVELDLDIKNYEIVQKTYKLSKDTAEKFSKYCKAHRDYKMQDLLTLALEEFLKNH